MKYNIQAISGGLQLPQKTRKRRALVLHIVSMLIGAVIVFSLANLFTGNAIAAIVGGIAAWFAVFKVRDVIANRLGVNVAKDLSTVEYFVIFVVAVIAVTIIL